MPYYVCPMTIEDIPQVMEIEREAFPDQWPPASYKGELKNKLARYFVLVDTDKPSRDKLEEELAARNGGSSFDFGKVLAGLQFLFGGRRREERAAETPAPKIVGAAGFWMMVDEAHITTIAVRNTHRGRGLGELLLVQAIDMARAMNAQVVTLEVRVSNTVAQDLYEKYGFVKMGVRKGYYTDNGEDAFIMTTDRITLGPVQAKFEALKKALSQKLQQDISLATKCEV